MRVLHTMIRVGDLDRSIKFYTDVLGMKLLRRKDYPDGKFTLAFDGRHPWRPPSGRAKRAQFRSRRNCVGYGPETEHAVVELTYNWGTGKYDLGSGFGHIALEVADAYKACAEIKNRGGKGTREAGPMKHGSTVIAFDSRHPWRSPFGRALRAQFCSGQNCVEDPDGYKIELIQKGTQGAK